MGNWVRETERERERERASERERESERAYQSVQNRQRNHLYSLQSVTHTTASSIYTHPLTITPQTI